MARYEILSPKGELVTAFDVADDEDALQEFYSRLGSEHGLRSPFTRAKVKACGIGSLWRMKKEPSGLCGLQLW